MFKFNRIRIDTALSIIDNLCNIFEFDMENGPWLAGGSARKLFYNIPTNLSDFDIYFKDANQYQKFADILSNDYHSSDLVEWGLTQYSKTYKLRYGYKQEYDVQLIKNKFYDSPHDLINDFDITVCQFATNGTDFIVGETTLHDCEYKLININKPIDTHGMLQRITKYIAYGFKPSNKLVNLILTEPLNYEPKDSDYA